PQGPTRAVSSRTAPGSPRSRAEPLTKPRLIVLISRRIPLGPSGVSRLRADGAALDADAPAAAEDGHALEAEPLRPRRQLGRPRPQNAGRRIRLEPQKRPQKQHRRRRRPRLWARRAWRDPRRLARPPVVAGEMLRQP